MNSPESPDQSASIRLLFVCTGNTCRSPMAEVLARDIAKSAGIADLEIRSAGVHTDPGLSASEGARRVVLPKGLSLEEHQSSVLTEELVEWADLILAMGPGHLSMVDHLGGSEKAWLLGAFAQGAQGPDQREDGPSVPDPFGGTDEVYEATLESLRTLIQKSLQRLAEGD